MLGHKFAWVSCLESQKSNQVLRSVVHQLKAAKKMMTDGCKAEKLPSSTAELLRELPGGHLRAAARESGGGKTCK